MRMKKILWICGLPNDVRLHGWEKPLSPVKTAAWSWILGHLPPVGVELHILCPVVGLIEPRIDFKYMGAEWHCFRRDRRRFIFRYIWYVIGIRRFVRLLAPEAIHGWGGETGFGFMATQFSRRAVVSVQGLLLLYNALSDEFKAKMATRLGRCVMRQERLTYCRAARLVCESETSNASLKQYYGCRGVVVPQPLRAAFYEEHEIKRNAVPTFLFVGSLVDRKGAIDVVKAFAAVRDERAKLIMIGEGVAETVIRELILKEGLVRRVELLGGCMAEVVAENMRRAHFFALPSYADTGPNALKEALACGLFPICYDNTGPREYIIRYCGYLVPTGDVDAYAGAMNRAVSSISECMKKGKIAAEQIRVDLSRIYVWEKLRNLYEGLP